jgi:D-proline reductase (dithiol) PrdB
MTLFSFYPADRAHHYEQYAAEYVFVQNDPTPWAPLRKPLRECRVALIVSAGLRLKTQHEYSILSGGGSADFREISTYVVPEQLAFDFTNYDPKEAEEDLNVLAPVDRLKEFLDQGLLGGLHETFFSFFGLSPHLGALETSANTVAEKLRAAQIDVAFLIPANHVCNQTIGLIARTLEQKGISTVALSTIKEVTQQIKVPRALFLNFPFGRTLGRAYNTGLQHSILLDMIQALKTLSRPGRILELPYRWEGNVGEHFK